ncbi:MAG: hypothetical protein U5R48_05745 [Gammaproteobacteria bacterium]|nr:hypothetical protein [Gammaproteobacteria bacterium]
MPGRRWTRTPLRRAHRPRRTHPCPPHPPRPRKRAAVRRHRRRWPGRTTTADASEFHLDLGLDRSTALLPPRAPWDRTCSQWSLSLQPEWYASWNDGDDRFTFSPFLRVDGTDRRRTHADLREAYWTRIGDGWELHLGLRRVFWGRTESLHLVDVINQVDLVENPDEEDRLGQPMAQLVLLGDAGALELFLLPGARQRTFPSEDGRLAGPVRIDADARYTHPDGALHTGWAVRWSHALGDLEFGLAHFSGTAREPELELTEPPVAGRPIRLRPVYELVSRSSLDAQYILGDTALKLELLHRSGRGPRSTAFVAGFEHTFVGAFGTRMDLGILSEYLFDDRGNDAPFPPFDNDVFVGARLALNDTAGSRALAGLIHDHVTGETLLRLEASRRLGRPGRLALEGLWFTGSDPVLPGDAAALVDPDARWGRSPTTTTSSWSSPGTSDRAIPAGSWCILRALRAGCPLVRPGSR